MEAAQGPGASPTSSHIQNIICFFSKDMELCHMKSCVLLHRPAAICMISHSATVIPPLSDICKSFCVRYLQKGQVYYWNTKSNKTQWDKPRVRFLVPSLLAFALSSLVALILHKTFMYTVRRLTQTTLLPVCVCMVVCSHASHRMCRT